jgi:hypothetical protein
MDYRTILIIVWVALTTAGMILGFNGAIQLAVRNKTGAWKNGGGSLLAGVIAAGVSMVLMIKMDFDMILLDIGLSVYITGTVLVLNGVVQLAARNKKGAWKDGGANLLGGIIVVGVLIGLMLWQGWRLISVPG